MYRTTLSSALIFDTLTIKKWHRQTPTYFSYPSLELAPSIYFSSKGNKIVCLPIFVHLFTFLVVFTLKIIIYASKEIILYIQYNIIHIRRLNRVNVIYLNQGNVFIKIISTKLWLNLIKSIMRFYKVLTMARLIY